MNTFYKLASVFLAVILCTTIMKTTASVPVYSQVGSTGIEVEEIQRILRDRGLFTGSITGYYGSQTEKAVLAFQKQHLGDDQLRGGVRHLVAEEDDPLLEEP